MLAPQKVKYRKPQKGRMKGMAVRGSHVSFGTFGLKALEFRLAILNWLFDPHK